MEYPDVVKVDVMSNVRLCILTVEEGTPVLKDSMVIREDTFEKSVDKWVQDRNSGELSETRICSADMYSVSPLTREETALLRRRMDDMANVKRNALARLENMYFSGWKHSHDHWPKS